SDSVCLGSNPSPPATRSSSTDLSNQALARLPRDDCRRASQTQVIDLRPCAEARQPRHILPQGDTQRDVPITTREYPSIRTLWRSSPSRRWPAAPPSATRVKRQEQRGKYRHRQLR